MLTKELFFAYLSLDNDGNKPSVYIDASGAVYLNLSMAEIRLCATSEEVGMISDSDISQPLDITEIKAAGEVDMVLGRAVRLNYLANTRTFTIALPGVVAYTSESFGDDETVSEKTLDQLKDYINREDSNERYDLYELPNGYTIIYDKIAGRLRRVVTTSGRIFDESNYMQIADSTIYFRSLGWIFNYDTGILTFDDDTLSGRVAIQIKRLNDEPWNPEVIGLNGKIVGYNNASVIKVTDGEIVYQDIDKNKIEVTNILGNYAFYMIEDPNTAGSLPNDIYAIIRGTDRFREFKGIIKVELDSSLTGGVPQYKYVGTF